MPVNKVRRRGSYAPLSSHYYKDDRLIRAGEKAELLYVRALAFCADVLNDGRITDAQLAHVGVGLSNVRARAKALVEVNAWRRVEDGYEVVAWLSWNKSRDDILVEAKKDSERKGKGYDQPYPPDPPPDAYPHDDPYRADSERNPGGSRPEAAPEPSGFQPVARGPARAPSNSRATPEPTSEPAAARADDDTTTHKVHAARLVGTTLPRWVGRGPRGRLAEGVAAGMARGVSETACQAALRRWANTAEVAPAGIDWMLDDAAKAEHGASRNGASKRRATTENVTDLDSFIHGLEAGEASGPGTVLQLDRGVS